MDITAYDECKVTLFQGEAAPVEANQSNPPLAKTKIDWAKWGTIIGGLAFVATVLIAILQ